MIAQFSYKFLHVDNIRTNRKLVGKSPDLILVNMIDLILLW